jgi:hypothetical protein
VWGETDVLTYGIFLCLGLELNGTNFQLTNQLTSWCKALHQKNIISQLVKKFLAVWKHKNSLSCMWKFSTQRHIKPFKFCPHVMSCFSKTYFNIILSSTCRSHIFTLSLSLHIFQIKMLHSFLVSPRSWKSIKP